ncbi:UDP-glucuronic acid decarboxylase family protein [Candidatus Omnitrophota bacterium]
MLKGRAVITGGAGFIGSHLCEKLLSEGYKVLCLDNFVTGSQKNIKHLLKDKSFSFKREDVSKRIGVTGKVDYVLHLASAASPVDYLKFPIETLRAGSSGTQNCLELAKLKKARFLLASTSEVYGDPLVHPQAEEYWGHVNPVGVRSCYDEAKRFAEAITMAYRRVHKVNIGIARIFNTYGPRMRIRDGRVVPNFIYQGLKNKPITVYGNGTQTRSFCYIEDMVEALFLLIRTNIDQPVNLGNPREFTILSLAKQVVRLTGAKSGLVFKPLPQDDPRQRRPDIRKARKFLLWSPKVQLKEGLERTIDWFKSFPSH